jgi:hypothetical protein
MPESAQRHQRSAPQALMRKQQRNDDDDQQQEGHRQSQCPNLPAEAFVSCIHDRYLPVAYKLDATCRAGFQAAADFQQAATAYAGECLPYSMTIRLM